MKADVYLRAVLTVIAAALVYLCVVLTPLPTASAQGRVTGAPVPGMDTGPAEMVIVGWRAPADQPMPVRIVGGNVNVTNELRVRGTVEAVQPANAALRTVLVGYEQGVSATGNVVGQGEFSPIGPKSGLPVNPQ